MIAVAMKLLSMIGLTDKAAKIAAPIVLGAAGFAALWAYGAYQFHEGKEAAALASERALSDDLKTRMDAFLTVSELNRESYEKTLDAFASIKAQAPTVIREIRDAPATDCSDVLISDDEWLRLRRAYSIRPAADRSAGGETG